MKSGITIKDVAKLINGSAASVSRVLNNRPGAGPQIRQTVLEIAKHLQYRPHCIAKLLISQRSFTIGFILNSITASFIPSWWKVSRNMPSSLGIA